MRVMRLLPALLAALAATPLAAQQGASLPAPPVRPDAPVVVSSQLKDVAVTVYRAPQRGGGPINPNWPQGFALVTETRVVTLPAEDLGDLKFYRIPFRVDVSAKSQ
ncbi:MAG: hypothetical protein ACT6Q3_17380, partial [Sphingopyxis sp.]